MVEVGIGEESSKEEEGHLKSNPRRLRRGMTGIMNEEEKKIKEEVEKKEEEKL